MATKNEKVGYLSKLTRHDHNTLESAIPDQRLDEIFAAATDRESFANKTKGTCYSVLVTLIFANTFLTMTGNEDAISPKAVVAMFGVASTISVAGAAVGLNMGPRREVNRLVEEDKMRKRGNPSL